MNEEEKTQQIEDLIFPRNKKVIIQTEASRMYEFSDKLIEIVEPVMLLVSDNGHLVVDYEGRGHYIPNGWKRVIFVPRKGKYEIPSLSKVEKEGEKENV